MVGKYPTTSYTLAVTMQITDHRKVLGQMLSWARYRAKRRGIEFSLTPGSLVIPHRCPVLGILLYRAGKRSTDNSPTLDRIDNARGYVDGNVQIISHLANSIKRTANPETLLRVGCYYAAQEQTDG